MQGEWFFNAHKDPDNHKKYEFIGSKQSDLLSQKMADKQRVEQFGAVGIPEHKVYLGD